MKNKLEYYILLFISVTVNLLPRKLAVFFARILAYFVFNVFKIRRKVAESNLKKAFPDKTASEINKILKENYFNFILTLIEIMVLPNLSRNDLSASVKADELDFVREKYNEEKGVIFLTAHFGNWEYGAASYGVQLNTPINVLAKPQRNNFVTGWINKTREKFGNKVIELGVSVRHVYKVILEKGIVGIVGDQRGPRDSVRVDFFGNKTAVFTGSASIAIKTKCPVLVILIPRIKPFILTSYVEEILLDDLEELNEKNIIEFNRRYFSILEKYVKKYPEQWFWMHNIWKY